MIDTEKLLDTAMHIARELEGGDDIAAPTYIALSEAWRALVHAVALVNKRTDA